MGMGMVLCEWEGMGTEIVLPAHLYCSDAESSITDSGETGRRNDL